MSYGLATAGTKTEVKRFVEKQCAANTSPEMPIVQTFLMALVDAVDDHRSRRIVLRANGWHSGGSVHHEIIFDTLQADD